MSWVDRTGAKADVARKTKRQIDPIAADLARDRRLLKYDQVVRLRDAGYSPSQIGARLDYTREWVWRILKDMDRARREITADAG